MTRPQLIRSDVGMSMLTNYNRTLHLGTPAIANRMSVTCRTFVDYSVFCSLTAFLLASVSKTKSSLPNRPSANVCRTSDSPSYRRVTE
jgi:hypothetical protein